MQEFGNGSSQDKILYQIKRLGPQTARELGEQLGVTTMGIRQHLAQMESEGLVDSLPGESRGRGRPVSRWKLTATGHGRFPDAHARATVDLIHSVRDVLGEDALQKVIDERTRETLKEYRAALSPFRQLKDRVEKLADLRSKEGYMAEAERVSDTAWRLIENHCPICIAAQHCQGFCQGELDVFQQALGSNAVVTREEHLLKGARRCSYLISAR